MTKESYVYYTFTDLENVTLEGLENIKERSIEALTISKQKKWSLISQILFYQNEHKKAMDT